MNSSTTEQRNWQSRYLANSKRMLLERVIYEGISQSRQSAHQAHWSFVLAMILSSSSAAIGLIGVSLLLLGHASEGTVTAVAGLASSMCSHQISQEATERQSYANQRLDNMLQQLYAIKAIDG